MKIAVTGASGHIGSNLCRKLIELGHRVKVLYYQDKRGFNGLPVEHIRGSMDDKAVLKALTEHVDVVFHLAAQISIEGRNDRDLLVKNIEGTKNVVKAVMMNKGTRLIHFSSIHSLLHPPLNLVLDENRSLAFNDPIYYTRSKAFSEKVVLEAVKEGLDAVILNPTAVVGPHDYKPSLLGSAIIRFYKGTLPALIPGGYDWVDVRDISEAAVKAIERGKGGQRYILSGHWRTLKVLGETIEKFGGHRIPSVKIPFWLAFAGIPFFRMLAKWSSGTPLYTYESLHIIKSGNPRISHSLAAADLDYKPRPFEETIKDILIYEHRKN